MKRDAHTQRPQSPFALQATRRRLCGDRDVLGRTVGTFSIPVQASEYLGTFSGQATGIYLAALYQGSNLIATSKITILQ